VKVIADGIGRPVEWPTEPEPLGPWEEKAEHEARLPNSGADHLERCLGVIVNRASAQLTAVVTGPAPVTATGKPSKPPGPGVAYRMSRAFHLGIILAFDVLVIFLTERAFFVFMLPPLETRLVVIGVSSLFVYAGHVIGTRWRRWSRLTVGTRWNTVILTIALFASVTSVGIVRATVGSQDSKGEIPQVGLPLSLAMFISMALLIVSIAIDFGLASGRKEETPTTNLAESARLRARTERESRHQQALERRDRWGAARDAFHGRYLATVIEFSADLLAVKAPDMPMPIEPWFDDDEVERHA